MSPERRETVRDRGEMVEERGETLLD